MSTHYLLVAVANAYNIELMVYVNSIYVLLIYVHYFF